jgi:hypothetical protein
VYGTVMLGRSTASLEQIRPLFDRWVDEIGREAGFVDERVLDAGDGRIVMCVRFRDQAAYQALADNPRQHEWWTSTMAPLLDGEPEWIDGHWHDV